MLEKVTKLKIENLNSKDVIKMTYILKQMLKNKRNVFGDNEGWHDFYNNIVNGYFTNKILSIDFSYIDNDLNAVSFTGLNLWADCTDVERKNSIMVDIDFDNGAIAYFQFQLFENEKNIKCVDFMYAS